MRDWLAQAREAGYLGGIAVAICIALLVPVPLWGRLLLGVGAGIALWAETQWERRGDNRGRMERLIGVATGWWMFALGLLSLLASILVIPAWRRFATLLVLGLVATIVGLPGALGAVQLWKRDRPN